MKKAIRTLCVVFLMLFVLTVHIPKAMAAEIEDYPVIKLDTKTPVTIKNAGDYAYFRFTPTRTDSYTFYSKTTMDTYGYLYDSEMKQLASNDDSGEGNNFAVTYDLEAGKTYVFGTRYYNNTYTGSFNVFLKVNHVYVDEVITAATCTEPGQMRHTCSVCGDSYTTQIPAAHTPNAEGVGCVICGNGSVASGTCGESVDWVLYKDGTLVISGTGNMSTDSNPPWYNYRGNIKHAVIGYGVTSVGRYAFQDCLRMVSVELAESISSINYGAFYNCTSLTSIDIPSGVNIIDSSVFYNCSSLTSAHIPSGVYFIGGAAFSGCSSLTKIDLPADLAELNGSIFYNCTKLKSIDLPDGITSVGNSTFYGCSSLKNIDLPDSVTTIGGSAFSGCSSLKSIDLPDGVTTIGDSAFYGCSGLKSIIIPDGVSDLSGSIFSGCTSLTSVTLPDWLITINNYAFSDCTSLKTIELPDGVATIGRYAFQNCTSLTAVDLPDWIMSFESGVFYGCEGLTKVMIPDAITEIPERTFYGCSSLKSIDIPDGVTEIANYAFQNCSSLTSIDLPKNITSIAAGTFYGCSSLKSIDLPDGITTIGDSAFSRCTSLTSIVLPEELVFIDNYVFNGCENLEAVVFSGDAPSFAEGAFRWETFTAYYPANNKTWTKAVMQDYGGTITWKKPAALSIKTEPKTGYAQMGESVKVSVKVNGTGLKYQWYFKDADGTKYAKSSVKEATYSTTMSDKTKGRRVYCVITDAYGNSVQTKTVLLREAVSIVTQPKTSYAQSGKTVKVSVKASGDDLTYQWFIKNAGGSKYSESSVKSATYSAKMSDKVNGRRVYCVVTDKYGKTVQTKTVILRMAATITTQPKSVTVAEGKTAKVTVKAVGDELTYTWYIKNEGASKFSKSSITKSTYSVKMSDKADGRQVYCVVTDKYGKTVTSKTVTLTMK